ncbi:SOS response-associated peptidase [Alteribacter aurantiacus]|uniref:SOS response-associated peptidase n=1 Tax=Alteribacter aurantiacus TaxID=254410 RepID=UPI0004086B46|nr:SOS response-associated peptidase [Alteribacter aurantiacus]
MCGRFTLYADPDFLKEQFDLENEEVLKEIEPRYNIAPSQDILTIVRGKKQNRAGYMKWGLVPSWAKDPSIGYKMINARSETAHEKPSFKHLLKKRRCLICASGFYEWKKIDGEKHPYYIQLPSQQLMVFAGLWDRYVTSDQTLITCTILTTKSNAVMNPIHHRMPVMLSGSEQEDWLLGKKPVELFETKPESLAISPVSQYVNSPKHEGERCVESI